MILLLIYLTLTLVIPEISAQFEFLQYNCSDTTYTPNTTYESNVNTVLKSFSSDDKITYGYYNFSVGKYPDKISAMALCRGDVPLGACRLCVQNSASRLPIDCPNRKQPFGYSAYCVIFYSHTTFFHSVSVKPRWALWNGHNVSSITVYNSTLHKLMSRLQKQASLGNSQLKFATGEMNLTSNKTLYGIVQCSPDMSRSQCIQCVQNISVFIPNHFITSNFTAAGARVTSPSCNFRYELWRFYGNVSDVATLSAPPPAGSNTSNASIKEEDIETLQSLHYTLGVLKAATDDFSEANKLGEGGFGIVYKGKLPNEREVAVKRLSKNAAQGNIQFKNEILILAKLQHRNLVRLLGFCLEDEEMLLVYEFIINTSLDHFVFDPLKRSSMQWETRYSIINGISRGLLYLHEDSRLRIIHRDLKAENVLLDADFNPKIADFGMARLFNIDQTQAVASKIVGTYGYMAPEYVLHGHVSLKSDVFSFGVLVLEIISGQRIGRFQGESEENLLSFAWKNWKDGKAWNLVYPTLSRASSSEILRCIHIALLCVQHNLADRPRMSGVGLMLSSESVTLQVPSQPAFFSRSHTHGSTSDQCNDKSRVTYSINEVTMTQMYPR